MNRQVSVSLMAGALSMSFVLQGCSTTSGSGGTRSTAMDRAISECVASVAVGAIGGALLGAAIGGTRGAGTGALIGVGAGATRCAILVELAAAEDRQRLREAEMAALRARSTQTRSITTKSGKNATVTTRVSSAPIPEASRPAEKETTMTADAASSAPQQPADSTFSETRVSAYQSCQYTETLISMDGGSANGGKQRWCKTASGDWQAVES